MKSLITLAVLALTVALDGSALAQTYPSKPIRVIVPFVAGGSSDIVARAIALKFQDFLGQPGIVENKPGANGAIAAEFVAKAEPDGYTILVGSIGVFSINAALFKDLRYHPVRDFAPITLAVTTPNVLITKPTLAAKSVKDVVEFAKKNPDKLSYCSSGTGSSDHLTAELLKQMSETSITHVPYKGGAACQTDIMGNQVDISFQNLGAVTNYIKSNRMNALAVTARSRHPSLPDVPTAAEAGFPELVVTSWQAVAAPAKTPRDVVAKLNEAIVKALRSPDVRERMNQIGFDVVAGTPDEFGKFMQDEVTRWTQVVNRGGIKAE
ncbi:MAG TPA: tripartite tricarboxylate transporter substrate binding protein [Casimicrobiaceae bacterium]|nr:tripartite tricarboxylate transporter substrate binding protein [Casimicrobiaceae bacterium]